MIVNLGQTSTVEEKQESSGSTESRLTKAAVALVAVALVPLILFVAYKEGSPCQLLKKEYERSIRRGRKNNVLLEIAKRRDCSWAFQVRESF